MNSLCLSLSHLFEVGKLFGIGREKKRRKKTGIGALPQKMFSRRKLSRLKLPRCSPHIDLPLGGREPRSDFSSSSRPKKSNRLPSQILLLQVISPGIYGRFQMC